MERFVIKAGKSDIIIMIIALTLSAAVNILVALSVASKPYISLGLFIVAAGVGIAQLRRHRRRRREQWQKETQPNAEVPKESGAVTGVWIVSLVLWAATLIYAIFFH